MAAAFLLLLAGAPPVGAQDLAVSAGPGGLSVSGATPGGEVAWVGVGALWDRQVTRQVRIGGQSLADGAGGIDLDPGQVVAAARELEPALDAWESLDSEGLPAAAVWLAVDLSTGQWAVASPSGAPRLVLPPLSPGASGGSGEAGGPSRLPSVLGPGREYAAVAWVRPGGSPGGGNGSGSGAEAGNGPGLWLATFGDGSESDGDGVDDGRLAVDFGTWAGRLQAGGGESGGPPSPVPPVPVPGDLLFVVDAETLAWGLGEVTPAGLRQSATAGAGQ